MAESQNGGAQDELTLPQAFIDEMVAHAREDDPNECCGIIACYADGRLKLFRAENAEASPYRFNIAAHVLLHLYNAIEGSDGDMLVIYHSHLMTEARPSPTDLNIARMHKTTNPWPYWVLVSLAEETPNVRAWRIDEGPGEGQVQPAEIRLTAGELPPGSECVRLDAVTQDGRPRVREVPL